VGIENQPSLIAPKIKAISEMIFNWFLIRSRFDKQRYPNSVKKIEFIAPNAKLLQKKMTRATRKATVMKICENDIRGTEWESFYKGHTKRDDLADCYCQAKIMWQRITDPEWLLDPARMRIEMKRLYAIARRARHARARRENNKGALEVCRCGAPDASSEHMCHVQQNNSESKSGARVRSCARQRSRHSSGGKKRAR
jgi:hypothetical protein